jgi:AcrR family transcriptional regulator
LEAALRSFAERGFAGTRLEDVAASAGVSKGTVYLYFESKERLFEAVIREAVTPSIDQADALLDAFEGSTPNLLRTLFMVLEGALNGPFPAVAKIILAESGNFPALARMWGDLAVRRAFGLARRVIQRGVDRGELRPVSPDEIVPLVMAPFMLLGVWRQSLGPHVNIPMDSHAVIAAHLDTLLRGLAAPETGSRKGKR